MHANDVAKSTFGFRRLKKRRRPSGDPISTSGRRLRNRVSPDATTENDGVGRRNGDAIDDGRRKSGPRRRRRRRRRWHTRRNSAQATGHRFDSVARCRRRAGGGRRQVQVHVTPILGAPFSFAGLLLRHLLLLLLLRHRGRSHSSTPASRVSHRRRYRRRRDAPPRRYAADISHSIDRAAKKRKLGKRKPGNTTGRVSFLFRRLPSFAPPPISFYCRRPRRFNGGRSNTTASTREKENR